MTATINMALDTPTVTEITVTIDDDTDNPEAIAFHAIATYLRDHTGERVAVEACNLRYHTTGDTDLIVATLYTRPLDL